MIQQFDTKQELNRESTIPYKTVELLAYAEYIDTVDLNTYVRTLST